MTAVLHAQYSYLYVTQLDIHILRGERDAERREFSVTCSRENLARIKEGDDTIRRHLTGDPAGIQWRAFTPGRKGRLLWREGVLGRGGNSNLRLGQAIDVGGHES